MEARVLNAAEYEATTSGLFPSPRLLVYRTRLEQNLSLMRRYLESVLPGSGFGNLTPHVKTHKSSWVTRLLIEAGVRRFKCTPHEIGMLCDSDATDIFVAYPLLPPDADRLAECAMRFPDKRFTAQVSRIEHAEHLSTAARRHGVELDCLIDLNVGQDRTGTPPEQAADLAREVLRAPHPLRLRGLHAYAGHNASPDPTKREATSRSAMDRVVACIPALREVGVRVERIVVGGTPGFLGDIRALAVEHRVDAEVEASPGTWVYWDAHYDGIAPGMFEFAALLLAQVIDIPGEGLATLNVGSKRWSVDQGPLRLFSVPGLEVVSTSEEHTVVRGGAALHIGDRVLAAPQHVCPTVNLWETFTLVGEDGHVEAPALPVDARNR